MSNLTFTSRLPRGLPRWLLALDLLATLIVFGFIGVYALRAGSPFGAVAATAVALCFPSAMLLGIVNGLALNPRLDARAARGPE